MNARTTWLVGVVLAAGLLALPALAADDAHGEDPELIRMDIGAIIGNVIVTLVVFIAVIAILGKFAWPVVLNVLNERERTIRESLESAKRERESAEQLLAEYKQQLDQARAEAAGIVEQGRKDADVARQRILDEARDETQDMTQRAKREITLATETAVKELYDQTAELSVRIAGRVIGKELSADDHRRLIEESIKEIRESGEARLN